MNLISSTLKAGCGRCVFAVETGSPVHVTASGQRVVILRTFVKKTQKTPRREIELALRRAKEIT